MSRPDLTAWLARHEADLVGVRRQLHAHPELGRAERRTTDLVEERLRRAGLVPRRLPGGTGLVTDVGPGDGSPVVLRADLDALPIQDEKPVPYRSTVPGVAHACGHDVHTTVLLGAGLALAELAAHDALPGPVRLVFQPAEELTPGGALDVIDAGGLAGAAAAYALHCDPRTPVGCVAVSPGPITSAADGVTVTLTGPGGHTARPHLTADLVYALAEVVVRVPALLTRRVDPRAGLSLVWGEISAGTAPNVIPHEGTVRGTLRVLDRDAWAGAPELIRELVEAVAAPYGATVGLDYRRGVPPVVNDPVATEVLGRAAADVLGPDAVVATTQSLGGEDFGWFLERVPGALARLGVAPAQSPEPAVDLHRGSFDVDERAIGVGVRVMVAVAYAAMEAAGRSG